MKNYRLLILFLLGLGFITASFAQERLYIGKLSDVAANYRKQAAAAANPSVVAKVAHSVPAKAPIELKLNATKREGASESFYGEVADTKNSNFFLQISAGRVSGSIIMRDQKKYYRYSSTADGSVFLTEEDIDKIICVGIPKVDPSRVPQAPPVQASQMTAEERKRQASPGAQGEGPEVAEVPFHQSLPGAVAVMYMDFDGQLVSGTPWNSQFNNGNSINAAASTLTDAQMTEAWKIMAEDYRPFNINVTTSVSVFNAAPANRRMRVIFTSTDYFYPGVGGVAYIGSFTWGGTANGETPCWVFNLGGKAAGETGSHEGGHTLHLGHDGRTSPNETYFAGQNQWAPIMGVGFYRPVVQWSKGEYPFANNTEDDLSKISTLNGFGYRTDDHAGSIASATPLVRDALGDVYAANNKGVISGTFDADVFSFSASGPVSFTVNPDPDHPNLDVYVSILNSAGGLVTASNPAGMAATINANLASGTYYLVVDGTQGALGANSQYGSLGAYSISSPVPYCLPSYTTGCSSNDFINNFSLNTLVNNASGCTSGSAPGYTNYAPTGTRTTNLKPGLVYALSMQSGSTWAQGFGVWIDYNRDNDFNDAGEFVYASPSASTATFNTTITIPTTASVGMTRMRVRSRFNSVITSAQSCTEFSLGETEDYTISISPYCVPTYTVGCSSGDYVYNFSFNTLVNNASGCTNGFTKGYTVYLPVGSLTTSVRREETYPLKVQAGSTLAQGFAVWIDYNKDTDFDDAGEFVYSSPSAATSLFSANITIPASAPLGNTRLRVRSKWNATVAGSESCASFSWGEAEDYTISILTAPPPPPTTKLIKVNIFGGTNPYTNPEWNNWNVTASLNSGSLKYSDATTSSISAALSKSDGVGDQGTSYGGVMAPPEVLRHVSSSSTARTLTFSGLSTSKTYSLELYASRANTGNSTKFTVNGTAITIVTDNNKTNKASFTGLAATPSGQLVVSIDKVNNFNYLNGFILTEDATPPPPPSTKLVKVNLYGGTNPFANPEWNNWNVTASLNSGALKYSDATNSAISAALSKSDGVGDQGTSYGGVMAPPEVLRHVSSSSTARTLTFSGLSTSKTYSLELYASRANTGNSTKFTVNGTAITIVTDNNKTNKASFTGLAATPSGQLVVSIDKVNNFNYLNGFILTENATPPPPPSTKLVKVNLYGGTNPFANPEWNNWNVTASLASGALKYSDATNSSISAALSKSDGVGDQGTSYGGVMAPPEVLRHVSSSSTARTLTFSGLSTSKTYSLELYASRANTGNSTKFTVNGTAITIVTDNNKTNKASFTGLAATPSGQLVVSIDKVNNFNYLNGFILSESTAPAPPLLTGTLPVGNASEEGAIAANTPGARKGVMESAVKGLQVQAFPNPSTAHFTFVVRSTDAGSVDLRIVDAVGRVVERRQNIAPNTTLTMGRGLKGGSYFLQAVQGTQTRSIKLLRKE